MSNTFFVSDPHFGHVNMAMKRGFSSVEKHDATIIKNWNSVVKKRDIVYLLGDVTMEKANYEILDSLLGIKKVTGGNHDMFPHTKRMLEHIHSYCGCFSYKGFIVSHIPVHPFELKRYRGNIHGHVHENTLNNKKYFNVSMENVNYTPVLFESILQFQEDKKILPTWLTKNVFKS